MKPQLVYNKYKIGTQKLQDITLLCLRIILAYGFYNPAIMKLKDINAIGDWFKELGIPLPYLNAYIAAGTEIIGLVLIAVGLGTRIIAIPMIIVMLVAIKTVHWPNGFEAGNNGYEIPLYYILMLFTLLAFGAGKLSIDGIINFKKRTQMIVA